MKQLSFADAPRRVRSRLVVLPDAARVEERLLQLARVQGLVAGKVACSVADLERDLVRAAQREGRCPAIASGEVMLLALREAAREHSRGPYFAVREQRGYVRALGSLLAALNQGLIDPDELGRLDLPERVAALAKTLSAARATLDRAGLVEPHRALRIALERVCMPLPDEVEFDGIFDWPPLRLQLAAALGTRARVRLPWSGSRPDVNQALEPALRWFEAQGGPEVELFEPPEPLQPALVSCASPAAEARQVALRCAQLLSGGAAPDSIAVAARTLGGGVAEELSAALERSGIPWRERRGRPALLAAPVRLALSLPELIADGFPREPLIDLLGSRLLWMREEGEHLPPQALARRLREAHARDDAADGGYGARLSALQARLELGEESVTDIPEVKARVQRVIAALRALPVTATLREHSGALLSLLSRWGLPQRLRAQESDGLRPAAAAALARDQTAERALDDACAALARGAAQAGLAGAKMTQAAFAELLAETLADVSLPPGGARGGAVQLMELRELTGRAFDHVLVTGLVDGVVPARPRADPLLSDEERRAVNKAAKRAVFRDKALEEPLLFQLAQAAARKSLTLLWPRADAQGRELLRSPYADEAVRALGREAEASQLASIPAAAGCAGAADLLARAALDAFADPAWRVTPPAPADEARRLAGAVAASERLGERFRRIARAAQAERERVRVFIGEIPPGRFSGQLSGEALQIARARFAFGPDAPASAAQLQDHALCGFRTLGRRLLHLSDEDEDDVELGHKERGDLLHRCLERYYREGGNLREVAEAEMDAFALRHHVGHRALWELKRERLFAELAAVVESEEGCAPIALEQHFGYPGGWPALRIGDVHIRGKIDRLDRAPGGGLVVIDYKSGGIERLRPRLKEAPEPEYQLPIYAAAVLQQNPGASVEALYLSLKDAKRTAALPDVQAELAEAVPERAAKMRAGVFPVRPMSCDYCQLRPACRLVALPVEPQENAGERTRA